jgi:hypothetical protein
LTNKKLFWEYELDIALSITNTEPIILSKVERYWGGKTDLIDNLLLDISVARVYYDILLF